MTADNNTIFNIGNWVNLWILLIVLKTNIFFTLLANLWYHERTGSMLLGTTQLVTTLYVQQLLMWVLLLAITGFLAESVYKWGQPYYVRWRKNR